MSALLGRNLEWKARLAEPAAVREAVGRLGARFAERQEQRDTYFRVPHGRLKLREIVGGPPLLIWYERPDRDQTRFSDYYLVPVVDAAMQRAALAAALGVRGEVHKHREIHLWHNVRVHLDEVVGLGCFVEFEAVLAGAADEAPSLRRLEELRVVLGIAAAAPMAGSYADLLGF